MEWFCQEYAACGVFLTDGEQNSPSVKNCSIYSVKSAVTARTEISGI